MNNNPCSPFCRTHGCDGECGPDPLGERLRLAGCLIRLAIAVVIVAVVALVAWRRAS